MCQPRDGTKCVDYVSPVYATTLSPTNMAVSYWFLRAASSRQSLRYRSMGMLASRHLDFDLWRCRGNELQRVSVTRFDLNSVNVIRRYDHHFQYILVTMAVRNVCLDEMVGGECANESYGQSYLSGVSFVCRCSTVECQSCQ